MAPQTKICQNCKKDFTIDSDDFSFYKKMKVPAPTWCWSCRMVRRMNFRNERTLYKRKCDALGHEEQIFSAYSPGSGVVYDQKYWWGDSWSPMDFGRDYDFSKTFFEQFNDLFLKVPRSNLTNKNNVNCEYVNWMDDSKNCYLTFGGGWGENIIYGNRPFSSRDSVDIYFTDKVEFCYENINCQNSYKLFFGENCSNCVESFLMYDCKNCSNCFGCVGLRNKQYHVFNIAYTKDDYIKEIDRLKLGNYSNLIKNKKEFEDLKLKLPKKFASFVRMQNTTGDYIIDAKNCKYIFDCVDGKNEDSKFAFWLGGGVRDMYDGIACGVGGELIYESVAAGVSSSKINFSVEIRESQNVQYSVICYNCSNLFGCVGLRNKSYCILNHQYTKEQYEELVPKIIQHMNDMPYIDAKGRVYKYGEFFPTELSPFCYNETIAQEYFPLTKEEALKQGYQWKDAEERNYTLDIKTTDIPDNIQDVDESILGKVIECEHQGKCNEQCTEAFKIIAPELQFYQRMNLPLPHLCPNCRHYQRLKQRNPLKLWHRACMCEKTTHTHIGKCPVEFETSYAPERPEIIYCEKCYQGEVY
ncbi:MAG: hypothetical protein PHT16_03205 [Candidatus Pacebacteria bacterium]|nr:hypothetical protein [Candidatus Paceibacterota bacterium]